MGLFFNGPRPWWVNYVEDRDLWRWKLPYSRYVNAFIMTFPRSLEAWDRLVKYDEEQAIFIGRYITLQIEHYVNDVAKQSKRGKIKVGENELDLMILNVPYINCSEVGEKLTEETGLSLTWFERADNKIQFSLRSRGDLDVSEIARQFGGGGHKNAAGFVLPISEGRAVIDGISYGR